jgi:hypothetical protein
MDKVTKFWLRVTRPGPDDCWEWQGGKDHGYGVFSLGRRGAGRIRAHRMAWELAKGPIPEGKDVLHKCDNRPCVNPKHLYLGTDKENARDRSERGQAVGNFHIAVAKRKPGWNKKTREDDRRGYNTAARKFSPKKAAEVRELHAAGESMRSLAEGFGVSHPTISSIVHRRPPYDKDD